MVEHSIVLEYLGLLNGNSNKILQLSSILWGTPTDGVQQCFHVRM